MQKSKQHSAIKNIVVIGGGTGTFTVLTGLKKFKNIRLSAIVSMADDGGSTGQLRDELGVLPPGDVRQCLVALAKTDTLMRELFNYRFEKGGLKGHSFGNLFLTALEKMTGNFDNAVLAAKQILNIKGEVIPVTLNKIRLRAILDNGQKLKGEHTISTVALKTNHRIKSLGLIGKAKANPKALLAIKEADIVIVGPGDLYGSIIPNLLVNGVSDAIKKSKAKKIFIANLMAKEKYTTGFSVQNLLSLLNTYFKGEVFDYVIGNNKQPPTQLLKRYKKEGEPIILHNQKQKNLRPKYIGANLINLKPPVINKKDPIKNERTFIRHDPDKLAKIIVKLTNKI